MSSLGTELPKEMARVRDELLPLYDALPNGAGIFAAAIMRGTLDVATKALAEGDLVTMIRAYEKLKGFEA